MSIFTGIKPTKFWVILCVLLIFAVGAKFGICDEKGDRIAKIFEEVAPSVVTVKFSIVIGKQKVPASGVCGILVDKSGLVMINDIIFEPMPTTVVAHGGVSKPSDFKVELSSGEEYDAEFIGRDDDLDVAFLRIKSEKELSLPALEFSKDCELKMGEEVVVIGFLPRYYDYQRKFDLCRVNAVITKPLKIYNLNADLSDSIGGPVITLDGKVVGIIAPDPYNPALTSIRSFRRTKPMVIPARHLMHLIANPPKEIAKKGWLGISMQALTKDIAKAMGLKNTAGVIVSKVFKGRGFPAEKAGIQEGDIITYFNGKKADVTKEEELAVFRKMVRDAGPNKTVKLKIIRSGKEMELTLNLSEAPKSMKEAETFETEDMGVTVRELTFDFLAESGLNINTEGVVVVSLDPAGWAAIGGLNIGDIVQKVNDKSVHDLEGFKKLIAKVKSEKNTEIIMFVLRGTETAFVHIKTDWK